ncbi:MAG: hypothetical protein A2539_09550 [Elusimicrobia bacterium RIFOXYD2_FULL_34_15]|nr:MAG: hypothetical protein A2539_09550 [Elusimicrobia bacterium RIFOXYD2_FULL_34_15]
MEIKYINNQNWQNFLLNQVEKYEVYSLFKQGDIDYNYSKLTAENLNDTLIGKYRSTVPLKSFFFPPSEKIVPFDIKKPKILVGVKACELAHLLTLDSMFLGGEYGDPIYEAARKNTILISADCTSAKNCCFCSKIEGSPYPTYGFDINLRPIKSGFVVETMTKNGEKLIENNSHLFQNSINDYITESEEQRKKVVQLVLEINKDYKFAELLYESVKPPKLDLWKEIAKECVECGGCRFTCSTCYCFLLKELKDFEKQRIWDTCQFKGYSRVAGGANPKPTKHGRYRNYYSCKINYRHENFKYYACTGCGRCIDVCPAEIDIRKVLTLMSE